MGYGGLAGGVIYNIIYNTVSSKHFDTNDYISDFVHGLQF